VLIVVAGAATVKFSQEYEMFISKLPGRLLVVSGDCLGGALREHIYRFLP
jgi:hypothetical protein